MNQPGLVARIAGAAVRYGLVGAGCALLNLVIVWAGTERLHLPYVVAALATCFVTIPVAYLLHRQVSFRKSGLGGWREWWRFLLLQLSQFGLGLACMAAVIEGLHWRPWLAMAAVSIVLFCGSFIVSGTWVFGAWRQSKARPSGGARALRVLQVSTFFATHLGGLEIVADQIARRMARTGVEMTWMAGGAPGEPPPQAEANLSMDRARYVDFVEPRLGLPAPLWGPASLRRLWRHVGTCDIVHVHDYLYVPSLAAILFARLRGRPVVLTQHIGDIPFDSRGPRLLLRALNRTLGRWTLASVAQVAFVGQPVMTYFERFVRFRRPPLLIPNGVDHDLYRPSPKEETSTNGPELRCLFVGRFVDKKGVGLLRRCASLPGIRWDFVGSGPMLDAEWAARHPSVRLRGRLAPLDVAAAMRAADLLVLPSRGEGFPLVVQEALACGTPVLVSQDVADAFPRLDARCVWRLAVGGGADRDAERLRERLIALRDDLGTLRAAREHAQNLARQWSWEACRAAYRQVYARVADSA